MRYSPYYSHKKSSKHADTASTLSAPTSPFQIQTSHGPMFKPTLTRSTSNNSNPYKSSLSTKQPNDDQKINNNNNNNNGPYYNNYYVPTKASNSIQPSPLYAAVQAQEQIKYQGHINQLNMNEFDLLQNKFEENYNQYDDDNDHNTSQS